MAFVVLDTGRELRVLLALRGRKAGEVAERAGLSEWVMSRLLNGHLQADAVVLEKIRQVIFEESSDADG